MSLLVVLDLPYHYRVLYRGPIHESRIERKNSLSNKDNLQREKYNRWNFLFMKTLHIRVLTLSSFLVESQIIHALDWVPELYT